MAEEGGVVKQQACLRSEKGCASRQKEARYRLERLDGRHCGEIHRWWCGVDAGVRWLEKRRSSRRSEKDRAGTCDRVFHRVLSIIMLACIEF
jgi:hypothetical protein